MGKIKKAEDKVVIKSVSILPEQDTYIKSHFLILSKFLQSKLKEEIEKEKKTNTKEIKINTKKIPINKIILGDCKERLNRIPDSSIDLVITSPPYADNRKSSYEGIPMNKYVEWFLPISAQVKRVLKEDGYLY